MDFDTTVQFKFDVSDPVFLHQSEQISHSLSKYDKVDMAKLMNVSDKLATQVVDLYSNSTGRRKPAIYAYRGDVYRGLDVDSLGKKDIEWANRHLLIPSGLYGLVRPLDTIEEYRLEMKTKLKVDDSQNLYEFWGDRLADYVESFGETVLVLASNEYAKAITTNLSNKTRLVEVVFQDKKDGGFKVVPIYSKIMRGVMARYIIVHRIDSPEDLTEFHQHGYKYDKTASAPDRLVFSRTKPQPIHA